MTQDFGASLCHVVERFARSSFFLPRRSRSPHSACAASKLLLHSGYGIKDGILTPSVVTPKILYKKSLCPYGAGGFCMSL